MHYYIQYVIYYTCYVLYVIHYIKFMLYIIYISLYSYIWYIFVWIGIKVVVIEVCVQILPFLVHLPRVLLDTKSM